MWAKINSSPLEPFFFFFAEKQKSLGAKVDKQLGKQGLSYDQEGHLLEDILLSLRFCQDCHLRSTVQTSRGSKGHGSPHQPSSKGLMNA